MDKKDDVEITGTPVTPAVEKMTKVKVAAKKGKNKKVYISVDTDLNSVVDWTENGYDMRFTDGKGGSKGFLELPTEIYRDLPLEAKERYLMAKEISMGHSVIETATEGLQDWKREFNITPGDPSAKLQVLNKDPKFDYQWSNMQRIGRRQSEGFEIDTDPKIRTYDQAESEIGKEVAKTVGGHKASEYVLMRRRREISRAAKDAMAKRYDAKITKAKEGFREGVEKIGAAASID